MTVFGREIFGPRAAPRRFAVAHASGPRVGLFETSSAVNTCVGAVATLVDCIDGTVNATMRKRYAGVTFSDLGMSPKCSVEGSIKTKVVKDSFDGVSGTVNICEGPEFDEDNRVYRQWAVFRADFRAFAQEWDESLGILSADDFRRCQSFAKDANAWIDRWTSAGVKIAKCVKIATAAGIDDTMDQVLTLVKWTVAGTLGIGALYVVGKLL